MLYPRKEFKTPQSDIKKPTDLDNLFNTSITLCKAQTGQGTLLLPASRQGQLLQEQPDGAFHWLHEDKIKMGFKIFCQGPTSECESTIRN